MNIAVQTDNAGRSRLCGYCGGPIPENKRADAEYCCDQHRVTHNKSKSPKGVVKRIGRLANGRVSAVIHFPASQATRALQMMIDTPVFVAYDDEGEPQ